jgi:hypothetical protein
MHNERMLKRVCVYLDKDTLEPLQKIGLKKGLKLAQMIRLAISDYVERSKEREQSDSTKENG